MTQDDWSELFMNLKIHRHRNPFHTAPTFASSHRREERLLTLTSCFSVFVFILCRLRHWKCPVVSESHESVELNWSYFVVLFSLLWAMLLSFLMVLIADEYYWYSSCDAVFHSCCSCWFCRCFSSCRCVCVCHCFAAMDFSCCWPKIYRCCYNSYYYYYYCCDWYSLHCCAVSLHSWTAECVPMLRFPSPWLQGFFLLIGSIDWLTQR